MKIPEGATVLGAGASFRGHLTSTAEVVIQGSFEGTIEVPEARVTVGEHARVRASIVAREVVLMGALEGDIHASGRAELRGSARLKGDIRARRLAIEPEAVLQGRVDTDVATGDAVPRTAAGSGAQAAGNSERRE